MVHAQYTLPHTHTQPIAKHAQFGHVFQSARKRFPRAATARIHHTHHLDGWMTGALCGVLSTPPLTHIIPPRIIGHTLRLLTLPGGGGCVGAVYGTHGVHTVDASYMGT